MKFIRLKDDHIKSGNIFILRKRWLSDDYKFCITQDPINLCVVRKANNLGLAEPVDFILPSANLEVAVTRLVESKIDTKHKIIVDEEWFVKQPKGKLTTIKEKYDKYLSNLDDQVWDKYNEAYNDLDDQIARDTHMFI